MELNKSTSGVCFAALTNDLKGASLSSGVTMIAIRLKLPNLVCNYLNLQICELGWNSSNYQNNIITQFRRFSEDFLKPIKERLGVPGPFILNFLCFTIKQIKGKVLVDVSFFDQFSFFLLVDQSKAERFRELPPFLEFVILFGDLEELGEEPFGHTVFAEQEHCDRLVLLFHHGVVFEPQVVQFICIAQTSKQQQKHIKIFYSQNLCPFGSIIQSKKREANFMSDFDDLPNEGGRLRKVSTTSKSDNLIISDASSLPQIIIQKKRRLRKGALLPEHKPSRNRDNENDSQQNDLPQQQKKQKKPKKEPAEKKILESNDQLIERLKSKGFCQSEEEDNNDREISINNDRDSQQQDVVFQEQDQVKKKKNKGGNLLKNKHKLLGNFDEQQQDDLPLAEEEFVADEKLVFEGQGTYELQHQHENFIAKVHEYKQKVQVFNDDKEPKQPKPAKAPPTGGIKRGISFNSNKEVVTQDCELEFFIPKIQGAKNSIVDATLFLNKMKQQGYNTISNHSMPLLRKQQSGSFSRVEFQKVMKDEILKRKCQNVNMMDLMKKFQNTSFDQIDKKLQQKKKQPQNNNSKEFNLELAENQDDMSSDDEEVHYEQEELNRLSTPVQTSDEDDDKPSSKKSKKSKKSISNSEQEAVVAIENSGEGESDSKTSKQDAIDEEMPSDGNERANSELDEGFVQDQSEIIESNSMQLQLQQQAAIVSEDDDESSEVDDEEVKNFTKLRKISKILKTRKAKQQELELKKQRRAERLKLREEGLKFLKDNHLVEDEAEQGSDNEEHDDIVKQLIDDDDQFDDKELEKELAGMIDNNLDELDEENEERAYRLYLKRFQDQEKEGFN